MKISNPQKFTSISNDCGAKAAIEEKFRILTVGDVIRVFAESEDSTDWHIVKNEATDTWVKYSFDGGKTWLLKFKFKNQLLIPKDNQIGSEINDQFPTIEEANANNEKLKAGYVHTFDFSSYPEEYFNLIKKSVLSFLAISVNEEFYTSLSSFRYGFTSDRKLNVVFLENLPIDTVKIKVNCQLDGTDAMALSLPSLSWINQSLDDVYNTQTTDEP